MKDSKYKLKIYDTFHVPKWQNDKMTSVVRCWVEPEGRVQMNIVGFLQFFNSNFCTVWNPLYIQGPVLE